MERQRQQGFPRALLQSLALMLALGFALLAPVSTASAHDVLTGTHPKDGQTLDTMPDVVDLGFSNMPLAIGTKILVEAAGGKDWAAGPVKIVDNVVSQAISPDAPGGDYSVRWRVVSSDGHPIEGIFGFTAKSGGAGTSSAQAVEPQPTADRSEGPGAPAAAVLPVGPVIGSVAVLLVLAAIIWWAARRRANKNGSV